MRRLLPLIAVLFVLPTAALAAPTGKPTCQFVPDVKERPEYVDVEYAGLKPSKHVWESVNEAPYTWYIGFLNTPTGQEQVYFRPGPTSFTAPFLYQGPGSYTAGLAYTVDNQKGPEQLTRLDTFCEAAL